MALAAFAAVTPAQELPGQDPAARRTCEVGRIDEATAPTIDGDLLDPCWTDAPQIGDLVTVLPVEGRTPTQRTVVRLLHDRKSLYIACQCFDEAPASIRATLRARDARLSPDDAIEILLDPLENRRTAYVFQLGAGGARTDFLTTDNGDRFDDDWDAVWAGSARITADGWQAEIAIPFRSLPRRADATTWGFNFLRVRRTPYEESQWANASRSVMFYRASQCGTLTGLGAIDGGIGLELVPYAAFGLARDRGAGERAYDATADVGGELYYRITPSLLLAATANTDFAETESDERQINLNRYPLFFPEKRDFFLEGSGHFQFGATNAGVATVLPFFSRRIGLATDGSKIPVLGGVKLAGTAGPLELGLLDVEADAAGAVPEANLAVARLQYSLSPGTTVGAIGTHGDPDRDDDRSLAGVDFHHRVHPFVGDLDLRIHLDAMTTAGRGADGSSFAYDIRSRGAEWAFSTSSRWIDADFAPAIGFVSHPGTRAFDVQAYHMPQCAESSGVRNLDLGLAAHRREYEHGGLQEEGISLQELGATMANDDRAYLFAQCTRERIDADFTLFRGTTTVFAGDYSTTRAGIAVATSPERSWDANLQVDAGGLFDGTMEHVSVDARWRASALLHLGADYDSSRVDLGPGRAFTTHIVGLRCDLAFTPDLVVHNLVQFDNESNVLGWQTRLRWTWSPGSDLFAILGTNWRHEDDGSVLPTEQALQVKLTHSLRF